MKRLPIGSMRGQEEMGEGGEMLYAFNALGLGRAQCCQ